jgi:hypothetical protein
VFEDGSQAYLSTTPVRMIMEFDGVSTNATSATLSVGQDRVQNVPITAQQNASAGAAQQQPAETASPAKPEPRAMRRSQLRKRNRNSETQLTQRMT